MTRIVLATEDILSEAVGLRLLAEIKLAEQDVQCLRRDGFGYLRSKMNSWKELAKLRPVLLITDLDRAACPVAFRAAWLGSTPTPRDLLMRIPVRTIESWVLADHEAIKQLIGTKGKLPTHPDDLPEPKSHLLQLAKHAPKVIRDDLVKEKGVIASQGLGYNARLRNWIADSWCAERAAARSPSLARTRSRLLELSSRFF